MSHSHPTSRLAYAEHASPLAKKLQELSQAIATSGQLERTLAHLVDIRASQMNGCAFCLDMHVKEAKMHGERELRLHHVAIWRESPLFSARERAALAFTEALTAMTPAGVPDELYAEASGLFTEQELATLAFRVATINAWNRLSVAFRTVPGSLDKLFGLDKAGLV